MNIAQTASKTTEVEPTTTTIYVNVAFNKLAADMNGDELAHQFNGKGRKIALIPEDLESNYLNYSSDKAGLEIIKPPFEINNGDNIKFKLQAENSGDSKDFSYKWKGILQNRYDLRLVAGKKSTYNAVATEGGVESENDEVIININFKSNNDKFSAAWDPQVKIKR